MKVRKIVWKDPCTYDEDEYHQSLSENDSDWSKLIAVQTTWGVIHYYDEDVIVVATEMNSDGTPREVLVLPTSIVIQPKFKKVSE